MASNEELRTALRQADAAGDTHAAQRFAARLKEQGTPSGMEQMQQFGRGAVPFANEVRGGLDATMTKLFGDDEASWGELQDLYSEDQDVDEAKIRQQDPGLAKILEAAGGVTSLLTGGGAVANVGSKAGTKHMAREAAENKLINRATKPRVKVPAQVGKAKDPKYAVRTKAGVEDVVEEVATIAAPRTVKGTLKSAGSALKTGAEHAAVVGTASYIGGPVAGGIAALARTPWGKAVFAKEMSKLLRGLK